VGNDKLNGTIEGDFECVSSIDGTSISITGYDCDCSCNRMYLTFETFANIWFPILLALGLYCFLDAVLTHIKDKDEDMTWCPIPYRLAEKFPKEMSWKAKKEERRKKEVEALGKRVGLQTQFRQFFSKKPTDIGGDERIAMVLAKEGAERADEEERSHQQRAAAAKENV